jgi:hypothetical protein
MFETCSSLSPWQAKQSSFPSIWYVTRPSRGSSWQPSHMRSAKGGCARGRTSFASEEPCGSWQPVQRASPTGCPECAPFKSPGSWHIVHREGSESARRLSLSVAWGEAWQVTQPSISSTPCGNFCFVNFLISSWHRKQSDSPLAGSSFGCGATCGSWQAAQPSFEMAE